MMQHHVLGPEEDQVGERPAGAVAEEEVARVAEHEREQAAEQPLEGALQQEGPADEPVGRADQPHDGDLAGPLQHREPDGHADDDDRDDREREADHEAHQAGDVAQLVQPLHPVPPEAHVVHEAEAPQPLGHALHASLASRKPSFSRTSIDAGSGFTCEVAIRVAELDQLRAGPRERLLLAHEARRPAPRERPRCPGWRG